MTVSHPSMRRAKVDPKPTNNPEVYVVDNASEGQNEDILIANEQAALNKTTETKLEESEEKTNLLEDLLFLGSVKKEVAIGKLKFEISTLTQNESAELMKELYRTEDGADLFTIRVLTLAYAVKSVNGVAFDDIPLANYQEEAQFETGFSKKMAILGKMQKNVVEKIHEEYVELVDKSDSTLSDDNAESLKNS